MAKASVEYRKRKIAEGAKQISIVLSPEDATRLVRLNERYGSNKQTIAAALQALDGSNDIDLPAALRRAAAEIEEARRLTAAAIPTAVEATAPNPLLNVPSKAAPEGPHRAEVRTPLPPIDPERAKAKAAARFAKRPATDK